MGDTYTQINLHTVFAVKYRLGLIDESWEKQLYKLVTSVVQENRHKLLQINSMPDHIHILIGAKPHQALSDLVKLVKTRSTLWINDNKLCKSKFSWQEGFCAISHCNDHVNNVIRYIQNQKVHHKKETLYQEQIRLLNEANIVFDSDYLFEEPS